MTKKLRKLLIDFLFPMFTFRIFALPTNTMIIDSSNTLKTSIVKRAEAMFMRYGMKSVTMDDIASELGISKKTLYQHFENKTDLISEVFDYKMCADLERSKNWSLDTENAIDELFQLVAHVSSLLRDLPLTAIYDMQKYYREQWSSFESRKQEHIYQQTYNNLLRGIQEGLYRSDFNVEVVAKIQVALHRSIVMENIFPDADYPRATLFIEIISYHLRSIVSEKGRKIMEEGLKKL